MKSGRIAVLGQIQDRNAAALLVDGRLEGLLIDPKDDRPTPGAIFRGKTNRPMKGQNGIILDLGNGQRGFMRDAKGVSQGTEMLVQVGTFAEGTKAAPVTQKLLFKSRYCIITPTAPGLNIARSIKDDDERDRLLEVAHEAELGEMGLILRSACKGVDAEEIEKDVRTMRDLAAAVVQDTIGPPALLVAAPDAHTQAWREWVDPDPDEVVTDPEAFETLGIFDHIEHLRSPKVNLPVGASMFIEPTSALVAVDINTGRDLSLTAGHKANMAAARDLPRQLRLRGLGGQIVLDLAPMPKKDRKGFEQTLRAAFRRDSVDTALVGWTPLGHYELQRKRDRIPLTELL